MAYTTNQSEAVQRVLQCTNYYELLCVSENATNLDIKKAYRKLALILHPDKNCAPGSTEAFKIIGMASELLTDEKRREHYDKELSESRAKKQAEQEEEEEKRVIEEMLKKRSEWTNTSKSRSHKTCNGQNTSERNANDSSPSSKHKSEEYNNTKTRPSSSHRYSQTAQEHYVGREESRRSKSAHRHRSETSRSRHSSRKRNSSRTDYSAATRNRTEKNAAASTEEHRGGHTSFCIPAFIVRFSPILYLLFVSLLSSYLIMGFVNMYFTKQF